MLKNFKNNKVVFLIFYLIPIICSEPLSCYRAKCVHCTVEFISKICPLICNSCPQSNIGPKKFDNQINDRVYGTIITNNTPLLLTKNKQYFNDDTQLNHLSKIPIAQKLPNEQTPQQNLYTYQSNQQTLGPLYLTNYHQNNLPNNQISSQQQVPLFQQQQQQPLFQQQQQQVPLFQQQQPFILQPQNSFNLLAQQQQQQQQQQQTHNPFYLQQSNTQILQPQNQHQQQYNNFSAQPTTGLTRSYNFFQPRFPQQFFNPFQPFLQQTLQAQQKQQQQQSRPLFQMFTSYQQSITPAPIQQSQLNKVENIFSQSQQKQQQVQPIYQQQQYLNQQQTQYPNLQKTQFLVQPYAYQQQQQQQQAQSNIYNVQLPSESNEQKKLLIGNAVAPNIDTLPVYINKKTFEEKSSSKGQEYEKCSKQPNWKPCITKNIANERYRKCCQRLGEGCAQICSYDQTLATIQLAVLTGRCPLSKVADMMICASGNEDATPCCQAYNVFEPGFEHCRPYCNPAAGLPSDGLLTEKYRCLGKLSQIQNCFYVIQKP